MRAPWFLVLAACGRLGFDEQAPVDLLVDLPVATPPAFVANSGADAPDTAVELRVELPPTTPGNVLIVSFTIHTDASVVDITDEAGNLYVSAGVRASMNGTSSEIWYAEQRASTAALQVRTSTPGSFNAYTLEMSGIEGAPAKTNAACLKYPPTFVQAPITTTVPDELIVTVTMFQFPVFVSAMLPPFTGLPPQSGNATGYLIAREPGTYASEFSIAMGADQPAMTCASSVSWLP